MKKLSKDSQIELLKRVLIEKQVMLNTGICLPPGSVFELLTHEIDKAKSVLSHEVKGVKW